MNEKCHYVIVGLNISNKISWGNCMRELILKYLYKINFIVAKIIFNRGVVVPPICKKITAS